MLLLVIILCAYCIISLSVCWGGAEGVGFGVGFVYLFGFLILALLRFLVLSEGSSPSVFNILGLLDVVRKTAVAFVPSLLSSYVYCLSTPSVSPSGEL